MEFIMERTKQKDGRTFSLEATYAFISQIISYCNYMMANTMQKGFDQGEPVDRIALSLSWKSNGKLVDDNDMVKHGSIEVGFNSIRMAEIMLKDAYKDLGDKEFSNWLQTVLEEILPAAGSGGGKTELRG